MGKRLRLFSFGLLLGVIIVFLMFGQRELSCNVMPNNRVLTEVRTKKIELSDSVKIALKTFGLNEKFIFDEFFYEGEIDFQESEPRKKPCSEYIIFYKNYQLHFSKCKEIVRANYLKKK